MKRRSFLGLLAGVFAAPAGKAGEPSTISDDAWEWDVHQTDFWKTSPAEFRGLVLPSFKAGDRLTIGGKDFVVVAKTA